MQSIFSFAATMLVLEGCCITFNMLATMFLVVFLKCRLLWILKHFYLAKLYWKSDSAGIFCDGLTSWIKTW